VKTPPTSAVWSALLVAALVPTVRGGPGGSAAAPAAAAAAAAPQPIPREAVASWREDLAFLRTEMPARHANLFHTMTPAQFDSALTSIDRRLPALSRPQIVVELMRMVALVGDGHSNVSAWRDTAIRFRELPVALYEFDEGLFVRAATKGEAGLVGSRVIAIEDVPADSALALVRPLLGRDNEMGLRAWAPVYLSMPEVLYAVGIANDPERIRMTVERGGVRRAVTLAPIGPFPMRSGEPDRSWMHRDGWVDARGDRDPLWLTDASNFYWYRPLPDAKALYVQINAIQQKPGDSLFVFMTQAIAAADSMGAERFVLDVRHNGGGNGSFNRAIFLPLIKSRYDAPGRLYVLTSRRTWSAAQMLISEMEKYTAAVFAGEPSASKGNHYGDSRRIVLPNHRVTVRVSSLYWQYGDPRDRRPWIEPDLPAPLTFAAYREGRDPALERVLAQPFPDRGRK
jgi:hypothetical protein